MTVTTLVLVRHGETSWNAESRIQGHLDIPLNRRGVAQAAALGRRLAKDRFDVVYASDLDRAFQTARPAVSNADSTIIKDPRLRERHLGVLQGLTGEEAKSRQPAAWQAFRSREPDPILDGGESLGAFTQRIRAFVEDMLKRHAGNRLLLVTHGGVLDAVYRHATATPLSAARAFPIYNASVNIVSHSTQGWRIDNWGDVSHLPQELAMDDY